jgi:argininosuccinate lyase
MKNKLWQTNDMRLDRQVQAYTVGEDYIIDQQLLPYDIKASIAHARMLHKIGIINKKELKQLGKGLAEILKNWNNGKFIISQEQEDGHTAIEQFLVENYGEVGKKIHTGRSRNDQSLVMLRLFAQDKLFDIENSLKKLTASFKKKIQETKNILMPGYTHMQKAMPTTVGIWLDSYLYAINDFFLLLKATEEIINQNPLGSAAGFGIKYFSIDRKFTTQKLQFNKIQQNPMYCAFSRGYFENIILQTLSSLMIILGRFANDMMLFTMQEFNFFSLPNNFTTGSSIMPQKKNYDVFEIMRGNTKVFHSYQNQIQEIISSLGSGYHRDLQLTKKPFVEGINLCQSSIELMDKIIQVLKINKTALEKAMTKDLFVTDQVYKLVKKGENFRDAYIEVKKQLKK